MDFPIHCICNFCSIDRNVANDKGLPIDKVDRVMAFGASIFENSFYFKFIKRLENIFVQCLSCEHLAI